MARWEEAKSSDDGARTATNKAFAPEETIQSRALALVVDLVRERDHCREQLQFQSVHYSRLEKELEQAREALQEEARAPREHMNASDRYSLTAEYLSLVLLSLGYDTAGRKIPDKRREKLIQSYCGHGKPIFRDVYPDDLNDAIVQIERKLGFDPERPL